MSELMSTNILSQWKQRISCKVWFILSWKKCSIEAGWTTHWKYFSVYWLYRHLVKGVVQILTSSTKAPKVGEMPSAVATVGGSLFIPPWQCQWLRMKYLLLKNFFGNSQPRCVFLFSVLQWSNPESGKSLHCKLNLLSPFFHPKNLHQPKERRWSLSEIAECCKNSKYCLQKTPQYSSRDCPISKVFKVLCQRNSYQIA